jgi:hypothetical protein
MAIVRPLPLRKMARSIASNYGDKGAVVITYGADGIRIGVENLTPDELREVLCTAINYSYVFESEAEEVTS